MKEIKELIEKLNYYTKLYDEGHPAISDKEWDDMYFKLQNLERMYQIYLPESPTQSIDYQVVNQLQKVQHNHLMLSLDKTKSLEDIYSFIKDKDYIGMAKMDGLTCSLKYLNGKLVSAETRGNGIEGENILHNALVVSNIPKRIDYLNELIIDGEIICTYYNFNNFKNDYKNPRNFASGSIRLLDSSECAKRKLSFIAWDCVSGFHDATLSEKLHDLEALDFDVVPYFIGGIGSDLDDIEQQTNYIKNECKDYEYPIDGLVFKLDNCEEYDAAGRTDHHFKGGLAYKFYDEVYETRLKDIEWSMGRTGKLTPVAIFNPVDIDGTEVNRASLHNISVMEDLGIKEYGQLLEVFKSNMIIPQVKRVVPEPTCDVWMPQNIVHIPEICPICGGPTRIIQENDSRVLYCDNPNCEGKLLNRIDHFFGKKGLDIKGISKATIEKLIDWGWVNEIADVFELSIRHDEEWKNKPGFGEKSVTNILMAIQNGSYTNLESVIAAAGIPLIGRTVARELAKIFDTYEAFREAVDGDFDFSTIGGFGYEMNKSLKTFNYNELDNIVNKYLTLELKTVNNTNNKLENLTFCITGKVNIFKNRDELSEFIVNQGGKAVSSMSAKVDYLINNDVNSTSAKNKKAQELGKPIINEQVFLDMFDLKK